jgi:BlaI family penicillinase repressor
VKEYRLTDSELKLAELIWANGPIGSGNLVKLCENEFKWKKSTTYTMLKRLERKEIFSNNGSIVSALISKKELYAEQSKLFVEDTFDGSLPKFIAAFTSKNDLSDDEIHELQMLIDGHKGR